MQFPTHAQAFYAITEYLQNPGNSTSPPLFGTDINVQNVWKNQITRDLVICSLIIYPELAS
jgi:hypothetical protein